VAEEPPRRLGGLLQVGGHAAFGVRAVHLELAVNRFDSGDYALGSLSQVNGSLCGLPLVFAVCADARYFVGGGNAARPDAHLGYLGIHVGVVTSSGAARRTNPNAPRAPR